MSVIDWCQRVRALLCVGADIALISRGIVDSSVLEMMRWDVVAVKLLCRVSIAAVLVAHPARLAGLSGVVVWRGGSVLSAHCEWYCSMKSRVSKLLW